MEKKLDRELSSMETSAADFEPVLRAVLSGLEQQLVHLIKARLCPLQAETARLECERSSLSSENARLRVRLGEPFSGAECGVVLDASRAEDVELPSIHSPSPAVKASRARKVVTISPTKEERLATKALQGISSASASFGYEESVPEDKRIDDARSHVAADTNPADAGGVASKPDFRIVILPHVDATGTCEEMDASPSPSVLTFGPCGGTPKTVQPRIEVGGQDPDIESPSERTMEHHSTGSASVSAFRSSLTQGFELLPLWLATATGNNLDAHANSVAIQRATGVRKHTLVASNAKVFDVFASRGPMCPVRLVWEGAGAVFIIYDVVTVPLQVFVDLPSRFHFLCPYRFYGMPVQVIYWSIDLPTRFFLGYYVSGVLETRLRKTSIHYLRRWFIPDSIILAVEYLAYFCEQEQGHDEVSEELLLFTVGRIARLLRFIRLVRLVKLFGLVGKLQEWIRSEYSRTILHVFTYLVLISTINHFIACGWYGIGSICEGADRESWVRRHITYQGVGYRYLTSLHWSFTQFTPASMEVFPTNSQERTYNIVVIVLAVVVFATFVGAITEAMTCLRKLNSKRDAQYAVLRRYIGENRISVPLASRLWRYFKQAEHQKQRRTMWSDVELFRNIPEALQADLHHEVYRPIVAKHPFFQQYGELNPAAMRSICQDVVQEVSVSPEQALFNDGQIADKMYFVMDGLLDYKIAIALDKSGDVGHCQELSVGQWASEAVIWMRWFHRGAATARCDSMLLALQAQKLHRIMQEYQGSWEYCRSYAILVSQSRSTIMSDLWLDVEKTHVMALRAQGKEPQLRRAGGKKFTFWMSERTKAAARDSDDSLMRSTTGFSLSSWAGRVFGGEPSNDSSNFSSRTFTQ